MTNSNPFTAFLNAQDQAKQTQQYTQPIDSRPTYGNNAYKVNPVRHQKMISYYMDLCENKRIRPRHISEFTVRELSAEIERLRALPYPASPAQLDKIISLKAEISELKGERKKFKQEFLDKLTGGNNGSASKLIQTLQEERKLLNAIAPATEHQINTLVEWRMCPDIPFEDLNIIQKIYLEKLNYWGTDHSVPEELEKRPWRLATDEEFKDQVKRKVKQQQANDFISAHRGKFYDWKQTRITENQVNIIRNIEAELANMYTPSEVTQAVDMEGNEYEFHTRSTRDRKNGLESAYVPLTEEQLRQMSNKEATEWIYRLSAERDNKMLKSIGYDTSEDQQTLQDKHTGFNERTRTGLAQDSMTARIKEFTALNDLIYKLESVLGYEVEFIHLLIKETLLDGNNEQNAKAKQSIMDMMFETIDTKDEEKAMNDVGRLYSLSEDSIIATELCDNISQIVSMYFQEKKQA